jgi:hypothetical protein
VTDLVVSVSVLAAKTFRMVRFEFGRSRTRRNLRKAQWVLVDQDVVTVPPPGRQTSAAKRVIDRRVRLRTLTFLTFFAATILGMLGLRDGGGE